MTEDEKSEFTNLCNRIIQNGRIYVKSEILNILVTLGKYNSSNQNDISLIEDRTGKTYDVVKQYCLKLDNLFTQEEKSIYGLRGTMTVEVQEKQVSHFSTDCRSFPGFFVKSDYECMFLFLRRWQARRFLSSLQIRMFFRFLINQ